MEQSSNQSAPVPWALSVPPFRLYNADLGLRCRSPGGRSPLSFVGGSCERGKCVQMENRKI